MQWEDNYIGLYLPSKDTILIQNSSASISFPTRKSLAGNFTNLAGDHFFLQDKLDNSVYKVWQPLGIKK